MKAIGFLFMVMVMLGITSAQNNSGTKMKYIAGYEKSITGGMFKYHAPNPKLKTSLLVRAKKGENIIEWESETIPTNYENDEVTFIWYFAITHDAPEKYFDLYIDDKKHLSFSNPLRSEAGSWTIDGIDGTTLTLNATMVDKWADLMGIAVLKVDSKHLTKGKPTKFKVLGQDAGKQCWYMTFEGKVNSGLTLEQTDIIIKESDKRFNLLTLDFVHLEKPTKIKVESESQLLLNDELITGVNQFDLKVPLHDEGEILDFYITVGKNEPYKITHEFNKVREWFVNIVMHSHTDIGYTRPQTEILPEHLRYIDYALDYCDLTDDYPDEAKFRWTCESTWPVMEYLGSRPKSQIDRLRKRVEEGRIELTGMMFNLSEMADESLLASMLKPVKTIRDHGLEIESAMQNDINGIGWCMVDYFDNIDIKYLTMGEHNHRALIPFDYPTVFWWQSPSGNKVLAYRSDHYNTGNMIGMHSGKAQYIRPGLLAYLNELKEKQYPFNELQVQLSGYYTDNSPPSLAASNLVKEWNKKYEWPKLRNSTATNFIKNIESNHLDELETYQAAWPDWWSDGFGSAARETAEARITQADLVSNSGLLSIALLMGADLPDDIQYKIKRIEENLLFYAEHTFGAAESIREPLSENSVSQWMQKSAFVWDAVKRSRMLKETAMGYIQNKLPQADVPVITIFNTLNWVRSGLTEVYIDHQLLPTHSNFKLVDFDGNEIFAQKLESRSDGTYWSIFAENIPPLGYKTFKIIIVDDNTNSNQSADHNNVLENQYYKVTVDTKLGAVSSIIDKEIGIEIVDTSGKYSFGEFIYETLSNRAQLERYGIEETPKRTLLNNVELTSISNGGVWQSISLKGYHPDCSYDSGISIEIRLYKNVKKIEFVYNMIKKAVPNPEAVYVAFPMKLENSQLSFETQGGVLEPGINQLPGTSSDWNVIQNFASLYNDQYQIDFTSNEIPLTQFGGLNIGRFEYYGKPKTTHFYSWVMNNYWVTNFKDSQEGEFTWRYSITSGQRNLIDSYQFGYGERIPFINRVLPPRKTNNITYTKTMLNQLEKNIVLLKSAPINNSNSILLQFKEIGGKNSKIDLSELLPANYISIYKTNLFGEKISENHELDISPNETFFIRIDL